MIKIKVPSSKSQTIRALTFACFAQSESKIIAPLMSPDVDAMISAVRQMGSVVEIDSDYITVKPNAFQRKDQISIDSGNSGLVLRFITALGALKSNSFEITGDLSVQRNRLIKTLGDALEVLGAKVAYMSNYGHPPIKVKGPIKSGTVEINGMESQPVSAILMACSFLSGVSTVFVKNPGEKPWVDLTMHWIQKLGGKLSHENYEKYTVFGGLRYEGFEYIVPGDFSTAAFPIVAAIITNSYCIIENLSFGDMQGDKKLIDILLKMGAKLEKDKLNKRLIIYPSGELKGGVIDVNDIVDAVPILAVLGCFCQTPLELKNCQVARFKESNRLEVITKELKKMGAKIDCSYSSLIIRPSVIKTVSVESHNDHRIAMALCVAALKAAGHDFLIDKAGCIKKTYPNFFDDLKKFES